MSRLTINDEGFGVNQDWAVYFDTFRYRQAPHGFSACLYSVGNQKYRLVIKRGAEVLHDKEATLKEGAFKEFLDYAAKGVKRFIEKNQGVS